MPARRGGVPFASGQSNRGVKFLDTRGQPTLGIVICQRCQSKRMLSEVMEDGNIKKFYVCRPEISRGCWDQYDPFRLPAPPPDDYRLPFVRPDVSITITPDGLPPLEPPVQDSPIPGVNMPTWNPVNGINIMWPFMGPLVVDVNNPNTTYQANPFLNPTSWSAHVTQDVIGILQRGNFDHVRIPVVPSPWIEALQNGDNARIEYLFSLYDVAVNQMLANNIKVLIDMHLSNFIIVQYFVDNILSTPSLFSLYNQVLGMFCQRYAWTPTNMVAVSLFNEPPNQTDFTLDWNTCQAQLYATARAQMPTHTLLLTSTGYSNVVNMVALNPSAYARDVNIRWDTHLYLPNLYAIQGYNQEAFPSFNQYITDLDWPVATANEATVIANMTTAVNADSTLTSGQKTTQIAYSTTQIHNTYDNNPPFSPQNATWIQGQINQLTAWATQYGVYLYCGEYGCTRTNSGAPPTVPGYTGASQPNRIAYWSDIAPMIRTAEIPRAVFALDAIDYGVTTATGQAIDVFDPVVLAILSPSGRV